MPREFSIVTATGRVRKSLACWWGNRARMLTRILETILSCECKVENTTLGRRNTWKGYELGKRPISLPVGKHQEETDAADQNRQHVEHVLPALGLEGLHHEDVEPAGHGKQRGE